jgi:hypothetical protein
MKLVFAVVGVILVMLIAYALTQVSLRPGVVEKGPIVASQWTTAPLRPMSRSIDPLAAAGYGPVAIHSLPGSSPGAGHE